MRPTPYVASLRVYEPISSFSKVDQQRWSQFSLASKTIWDEQDGALRRVITNHTQSLKMDGAHFIEQESKRYVAPWSTAARCWAALDDFKSSLPANLVKFFLTQTIQQSIDVNL